MSGGPSSHAWSKCNGKSRGDLYPTSFLLGTWKETQGLGQAQTGQTDRPTHAP